MKNCAPGSEAEAPLEQPGVATAHALVIGISKYPGSDALPEAVTNDARDVADILRSSDYCAYYPAKVHVLLDGDATLARIRDALDRLEQASSDDDTIIIYFSGHGAQLGGGGAALLPIDCDSSNLNGTALCEAEFSARLKSIGAARLVVILDACHSAGAGALKSAHAARSGFDVKTLAQLAVGRGRVFLASSRSDQVSTVPHGARNSVFTEHLLDGLRGAAASPDDGLVRILPLFSYVADKVRRATRCKQAPVLKADVEDNFPVTKTAGKKTLQHIPKNTSSQDDDIWTALTKILPELYPEGPSDEQIWTRAGGDESRLPSARTGRARWFAALRILKLGGGGDVSVSRLVAAVLDDFPQHGLLQRFK